LQARSPVMDPDGLNGTNGRLNSNLDGSPPELLALECFPLSKTRRDLTSV